MTRDHPGMLVQKQLLVNEVNWDVCAQNACAFCENLQA